MSPSETPANAFAPGTMNRMSPIGICYIDAADGEEYACRLSRVKRFRGQNLEEFGLIAGAPVRFSLSDAMTVASVELLRQPSASTSAR